MKNSYDIVADAVREYWKNNYPQTVIAFFYQKYEFNDKWEWHEELVECSAFNDYETVIYQNDFCEGQTCVKDISIIPLDDIIECYVKKYIKSAQPEIIRCKDCCHHHYEHEIPYCDQINYGYGWKDDDFCSRAERRENERSN